MRKAIFWIFSLVLLNGCFETSFNFKTVVQKNGKADREVQINGRGASRFLPPEGPEWEVKTSETQGGQSLLDDTQYHIHAAGHFLERGLVGNDFRYDVSKLLPNLTDEAKQEFKEQLGIPEPFEQSIGTENRIHLERKRSFFTTRYDYQERFEIQYLIPILLRDLKKEIAREDLVKLGNNGSRADPSDQASQVVLEGAMISEERTAELAMKKLTEEILPKFQFHSEVTLPGRIVRSNASAIHKRTAIWDFKGSDFQGEYSTYEIHVSSIAYNLGLILSSFLALFAVVWAFSLSRRRGPAGKRK